LGKLLHLVQRGGHLVGCLVVYQKVIYSCSLLDLSEVPPELLISWASDCSEECFQIPTELAHKQFVNNLL